MGIPGKDNMVKGAWWEVLNKPAIRWRRFMRDVSIDAGLTFLAFYVARCLAAPQVPLWPVPAMFWAQGFLLAFGIISVLFVRGVYSINVRYLGLGEFLNVGLASFVSAVVLLFLPMSWDGISTEPHKLLMPLLFGLLVTALIGGLRVGERLYSWRTRGYSERDVKPKNTLVIGAGDAGENIVREINRSSRPTHRVVGFIDDDPNKLALRIHSIPVVGSTEQIPEIVKEMKIEEILIAIPSAQGESMRRITHLCQSTAARVRTLPQMSSILASGPQLVSHLREIEIEDLLRREPVQTDLQSIGKYISGERILITGGGGSIGSELARQITKLSPSSLSLVGKGENSIYEIEQELLQTRHFQPQCVIADVRDRASMETMFREHRPSVVFHAAAHKHVPLMQGNPIEAIRNNVLGTWLTAELAIKYGAHRFLYVSTDKAVKPSSIMGATKRLGEMIVSALGRRAETEFAIVRFGNVLGSRGSLIPQLKAQIKRGGPVRVTHFEMTRYFMTIPEAVQLILQAGALGEKGEIFLLEMGQPVKILDLAKDLIKLHGLKVGEDIEIQFTGTRPGEKIHEELLYDEEELEQTKHPKIRMVQQNLDIEWDWLRAEVEQLLRFCEEGKADEARKLLMELAWGKTASTLSVPDLLRERAHLD